MSRAAAAGGAQRAGHDAGPGVDVVLRVADHRRFAGRAAGGVDAHDVVHGHGEHAERVGLAQVLLGGEGKPGQIGKRLQVVADARRQRRTWRGSAVRARRPRRGVCLQAGELQGRDFVAAGGFDRIEGRDGVSRAWRAFSHLPALAGRSGGIGRDSGPVHGDVLLVADEIEEVLRRC